MNNKILLFILKHLKKMFNSALQKSSTTFLEARKMESLEQSSDSIDLPSSPGINFDEELLTDWKDNPPISTEWWAEIPTEIVASPLKARSQVEKFLSITREDPTELNRMIEDQVLYLQEEYELWHRQQYEIASGIVPGSEGLMIEESRRKGLERLRKDRPEFFDPENRKRMKDWRQTYFIYYELYSSTQNKMKTLETNLALRGYLPAKLSRRLAARLTRIITTHLRGKSFTIFTGSPILPREEVVSILDLDIKNQKILLKPLGKGPKLFIFYYDFFYHKKIKNQSDGERALASLAPEVSLPKKREITARGLATSARVLSSRAKV